MYMYNRHICNIYMYVYMCIYTYIYNIYIYMYIYIYMRTQTVCAKCLVNISNYSIAH